MFDVLNKIYDYAFEKQLTFNDSFVLYCVAYSRVIENGNCFNISVVI